MSSADSSGTIEINEYFSRAILAVEAGKNVFVTGKAGTGKSTLLTHLRNTINNNAVVLAPTGVAAVNVRGQTIHSFFGFRPDITVAKVKKHFKTIRSSHLYKKLQTVIIDEISMVRADLLDCMDTFLRMHGPLRNTPFGGVQLVFFGDLYQLPPVVGREEREIFSTHYPSPYFFDAWGFRELPIELIELEKIYRQKDEAFIRVLAGIRNRSIDDELLTFLNRRLQPSFIPSDRTPYVHLVTTNAKASEINAVRLKRLPGKPCTFQGQIRGNFDAHALPAPMELELKVGSQVMLTNNDREGRWVNGTVGVVQSIEEGDDGLVVLVTLETGETVDVWPYEWEMFRFSYNQASLRIESQTTGSYVQYPIILAWALTIHKSQGKTFERVIVDMDRGAFAHGQTYVALSRATSLEGLVLICPIEKKHLLLDWRIVRFLTRFQYEQSEKALSLADKKKLLQEAIDGKRSLAITYLKSSNEKSRRTIVPVRMGDMDYEGRQFFGVIAHDDLRGQERVFRVDRILEIGQ
ncbi:AAA family ATPase [Candidatus Gottesmanbacteria bacterium]|nr:AAA family ATPase [Candidatus Gottesmanbacteria bacterium]